jgi:hypothetical protein
MGATRKQTRGVALLAKFGKAVVISIRNVARTMGEMLEHCD